MRLYRFGACTETHLEVHLIWIPKYRKRVLTGHVASRARDLLRQIALEHGIRIFWGKVFDDYIHISISHRTSQNIVKIAHAVVQISTSEKHYWERRFWACGYLPADRIISPTK